MNTVPDSQLPDERPDGEEILDVELFLVPKGVVLPTQVGRVTDIATIGELVDALRSTAEAGEWLVAHIEDKDLRKLVASSAHLFPVRVAVLTDVPGGEYDVLFDNDTYTLISVPLSDLMQQTESNDRETNVMAQQITEGTSRTREEKNARRANRMASSVVAKNSASAPEARSLADVLADVKDDGVDDDDN